MKISIISFTARGSRLGGQLSELLLRQGYCCEAFAMEKYAFEKGITPLRQSLKEWTGERFADSEAICFIGASGIAVRSIAPFVEDKTKDPAVIVMDEKGVFVISLLSGHLGGANELTGVLANLTGAIPVITTATDVNGRFAVDVFARRNGLYIEEMKYAKAVSADILDEKPVGLYSDFEITGRVPEEVRLFCENELLGGAYGIAVTLGVKKQPYKRTLHLIPRIVTLGIGCRKQKSAAEVEEVVLEGLDAAGISVHALEKAASIDLKTEEEGILVFCKKYRIPFETYTKEELGSVRGEYTESKFVRDVTGISNVCERSAVLGSGNGELIQKKYAKNGVTTAFAVRDWSVEFE